MQRKIVIAFLFLGLTATTGAQSKGPVPPADYGQWENLASMPERGGLSPDGKWLAYGVNRSNRNNELRITNVADGTTKSPRSARNRLFRPTRAGWPMPSDIPKRRTRK